MDGAPIYVGYYATSRPAAAGGGRGYEISPGQRRTNERKGDNIGWEEECMYLLRGGYELKYGAKTAKFARADHGGE